MQISVGFTGTQMGMTQEQKKTLELYLKRTLETDVDYHHGDCVGADEQFHKILEDLNVTKIIIHPPINEKKRAFCKSNFVRKQKEYLDRNKDIVDESDILIATPKEFDEQLRSGTWSTVRYADRKKKQAFIIYPNGMMKLYEKNK
jgi:hypothetical protein